MNIKTLKPQKQWLTLGCSSCSVLKSHWMSFTLHKADEQRRHHTFWRLSLKGSSIQPSIQPFEPLISCPSVREGQAEQLEWPKFPSGRIPRTPRAAWKLNPFVVSLVYPWVSSKQGCDIHRILFLISWLARITKTRYGDEKLLVLRSISQRCFCFVLAL